MGLRLYFTRLKCLLKNKENMFWCYMFPILLSSCFFFAFNNFWGIEDFETISIAYDTEGIEEDVMLQVLNTAVMDDMPMFEVVECNQEKAQQLLDDGDIEAYIVGSNDPKLYINKNSLNVTIIKSFLDNYRQRATVVESILKENPNAINEGLLMDVMSDVKFTEEIGKDKKPDPILIYFYSLLAYTCIYAACWGLDEVINIQANLSSRAARLNASAVNKMKLFLCNSLAAFTVHLGSVILFFVYLYFILKIDFGNDLKHVILICLLGALTGFSLGGVVGVWFRKSAEMKETLLTAIILGGSFLSGMMLVDVKFYVSKYVPFMKYINPVNFVSDGLYSLYYFDSYDRFYLNAGLLCAMTFILSIASLLGIRRKNYASI